MMLVLVVLLGAVPPTDCAAMMSCAADPGCCADAASCPLRFTCAQPEQTAEQPLRIDIRPIATIAAIVIPASLGATARRAQIAPPRALPGSVPRWLLFQSLII